jgi:hypothetical protein
MKKEDDIDNHTFWESQAKTSSKGNQSESFVRQNSTEDCEEQNVGGQLSDVFDDDDAEQHFDNNLLNRLFNIGYKQGLDEEYVEESPFYFKGYDQGLIHGFRSALPAAKLLGRIRLARNVPIPALEKLYVAFSQASFDLTEEVRKELEDACIYN